MAIEYKYKPYSPKLPKATSFATDEQKLIANLEKQQENLEQRLQDAGGAPDNRNIVEKALNLPQDQGFLMDVIEVLNRPAEFTKGFISAAFDEDPTTNPITTAFEGLAGKRGMTDFTEEVVENVFNISTDDWNGVAKFIVNVGGDILVDPLTYIPAGVIASGVGKILKVGSKTVKTANIVTDSAVAVGRIVKAADAGDTAAKALIKNADEFADIARGSKEYLEKVVKGGAAENLAQTSMQKQIKELAEKAGLDPELFQVVAEGSLKQGRRNLKDLAVYARYTDDAGERFVKIATTEVKDVLKGGFGITGAISLDDIVDSTLKNDALGRKFIDRVGGVAVGDKTLKDVVEGSIRGQGKESLNLLKNTNITKEGKQQIAKALEDIFFEDLANSSVKFLSFRVGVDDVINISVENARKYVKFKSASIGVKRTGAQVAKKYYTNLATKAGAKFDAIDAVRRGYANLTGNAVESLATKGGKFTIQNSHTVVEGLTDDQALKLLGEIMIPETGKVINITDIGKIGDGQYVLKTSSGAAGKGSRDLLSSIELLDEGGKRMGIDTLKAIDETEDMLKNLVNNNLPESVQTISLLQRIAESDNFLAPAAQAFRNLTQGISKAFNKTAGLSKDFVRKLSRIGGEAGQRLNTYNKRLAEITEQLVKTTGDPASLSKVSKIVESGAELTEAGYRSTRKYSVKNIYDNMKMNFADGEAYTILPEFSSRIDTKNFIDRINEAYNAIDGEIDQAFELVKRNGSYAIGMTDDIDLKRFKQVYGRLEEVPGVLKQNLNFGKIDLDDELVSFWRNNESLIGDFKSLRDDVARLLSEELGFTEMVKALGGKQGYLRHILAPDAAELVKKLSPVSHSKFINEGLDLLKNRKYLGTADEINKGLRAFHEGVNINVFDTNIQASMEDLIRVSTERLEQHNTLKALLEGSDEAGKGLFTIVENTKSAAQRLDKNFKILDNDFANEFSKLYKNLDDPTRRVIDEYFTRKGFVKGGSKVVAIQNSAYNYLKQLNKAYLDLPEFVKGYDKFLNTWKSVTLISPGFHMRNLVGNMSNSYLAGMNTVQQARYAKRTMLDFKRYKEITEQIAKVGDEAAVLAQFPQKTVNSYRKVLDYFESGVSQGRKGVRDLESVKRMLEQGGKKNLPKKIVEMNFNLSEGMDDFQRYMLYQWAYDKNFNKLGKTLSGNELMIRAQADASTAVTDALFDYSHLTGFEKEYMKRLFPFYTFFKNNLIFQSKNIIRNPGAYARLGRGYTRYVEDIGGMDVNDLPDYMADNMWLPIPITVSKDDKESIAFLKANLPFSDFTQIVENPFREGANFISTPVKLLFELGTGRDTFTGSPLKDFPGQKSTAESGFMAGIRDEQGNLAISSDPVVQKIANDLGLRVPLNYASVVLDLLDTATGQQSITEGLTDLTKRAGLTGVQTKENLEISKLYQDLEDLRNLRELYEQQTGQKLPPLT